jgi:hypothetical protein
MKLKEIIGLLDFDFGIAETFEVIGNYSNEKGLSDKCLLDKEIVKIYDDCGEIFVEVEE